MLGVESYQLNLFSFGPFFFVYSAFKVVVIALSALFSISALNAIANLHKFGYLAPFFNIS